MKIYHQIGFRDKWNIEMQNRNVGDGLIISPRFMKRESVIGLNPHVLSESIFDPQFFVPGEAIGRLETYGFFPILPDGLDEFSTVVYDSSGAKELDIKRLVDFQVTAGFEFITAPARFVEDEDQYISKQEDMIIDAFSSEIAKQDKEAIIQVVLKHSHFMSDRKRADILNWITGMSQFSGVYLIVQRESRTKQIQDIEYISNMLSFIDSLNDNDMKCIIGYCNTEAAALAVADPYGITFGSYENTRSFNISNFVKKQEDDRPASPNPRLYSAKLFQWIEAAYVDAIVKLGKEGKVFEESEYKTELYALTKGWHFTNPNLYKHFFTIFHQQIRTIDGYSGMERYKFVKSALENAIRLFDELDNDGIVFDKNSNGNHLPKWLTAINLYAKTKGWL